MDILQKIYGIGPVLAQDLINRLTDLGFSISNSNLDLEQIAKMLHHKNVYDTLPEATRVWLKFRPDRKIPQSVIKILDDEIAAHVFGLRALICGSYRRNQPTSNDADIVLTRHGDSFEKFRTQMQNSSVCRIISIFAKGHDKVSVLFKISNTKIKDLKKTWIVKSDIFICEPDEYIFMVLFATGSGKFNILMRYIAKKKQLLLNQRGLYKNGIKLHITSEREIFEHLEMKYRTPEKRELGKNLNIKL